jgi:hypothetical protein
MRHYGGRVVGQFAIDWVSQTGDCLRICPLSQDFVEIRIVAFFLFVPGCRGTKTQDSGSLSVQTAISFSMSASMDLACASVMYFFWRRY